MLSRENTLNNLRLRTAKMLKTKYLAQDLVGGGSGKGTVENRFHGELSQAKEWPDTW